MNVWKSTFSPFSFVAVVGGRLYADLSLKEFSSDFPYVVVVVAVAGRTFAADIFLTPAAEASYIARVRQKEGQIVRFAEVFAVRRVYEQLQLLEQDLVRPRRRSHRRFARLVFLL
jgi:hypothetical protein